MLKTAAGGGVTIGPILLGVGRPAHILTPTASVRRIVNMSALAVVDAAVHRVHTLGGPLDPPLLVVLDEAASIAVDAGLDVVMDHCVKIEYARIMGGLNWAGVNTGIVSARRGDQNPISFANGKPAV